MTVSTIGSNATQTATDKRSSGASGVTPVSIGSVATQKSSRSAGVDTVHISSQAVDLRGLEAQIQQLPDVDKVRVTELRNQIANGQYQFNYDRIAERILGFESEL